MDAQSQNGDNRVAPWEAERLRITVFLTPAAPLPSAELWEQVVGEAPDKKVEQPRIGVMQCEGPFASGKLVLRVQPARIDWLYVPSDEINIESSIPPVVGSFDDAMEEFTPRMKQWLRTNSDVQRLAFGPSLDLFVNDHECGYQRLNSLLTAVEVDPTTSDFRYQINRPRPAESVPGDMRINRLSNWSVRAWKVVPVTPQGMNLSGAGVTAKYGCHLDLDINTDAERAEDFSQDVLEPLLDELISLAKEITEEGDIP